MSWEAGASLGTLPEGSQAKPLRFSPQILSRNLPGFRIFGVVVLLFVVVGVVVFIVTEIVVVFLVVVLAPSRRFERFGRSGRRHVVVGSAAGLGFGGAGGG